MKGHRFPADARKRLNNDERKRMQPAEDIMVRMAPLPGEVAADLGCGTGYVTIPMAARVTKVYAIDAQQAMLDALTEDLPPELKDKVVPLQGELPRIPLEDGSIDRVVAVNVVHEVGDLAALESELRRCLRPGGRFTIVDFPKRETSFGPPVSERLSEDEVLSSFPFFHKLKAWSYPEFYQLELSL